MALSNEWRKVDATMYVRRDGKVKLVRGLGHWAVYVSGSRVDRCGKLSEAKAAGEKV